MKIGVGDRVVVTGASGFLGRHLVPVLRHDFPGAAITGLSRRDGDLLVEAEVGRVLGALRPTVVVHLAAYSGGIGANRREPASFFHQNLILMENVFRWAALDGGVRKLLYPMGGCSYPADAVSPIDEDQMWRGYPVPTSDGYSMAKKMGLVAADVYRRQYGLNSTVVVPGNMYGEYDNYHAEDSHVIPALIRRFHAAARDDLADVTLWGSGSPTRDFVYAGDVARLLPHFLAADDMPGPINLSSGTSTTIRALAETVAELSGYRGRLVWDTSRPDGQLHKIFAVERLHRLGLSCPTPLRDGLARTVAWYAANVDQLGAVRL